jgi:hypothetical protein
MSRMHLERALYFLGHDVPLVSDAPTPEVAMQTLISQTEAVASRDPTAAVPPFNLTDRERAAIRDGDVAQLFMWGIHPNLIRNFAGAWGINYVERYRAAGL